MPRSSVSYVGTHLDRRYRLDRLVGEGASAWVFAAHDIRLEREVAIKLLKPSDDSQRREQKQFVEEGRTLAKLVHPHVVLAHDAAETDEGLCYLVMELSTGGTLDSELVTRGKLPVEETLHLLLPLLGALACAHDRGIIHRDIKPANIALQRDQREVRAKLLDFGIAQRRDRAVQSEVAIGTPSHMAPEQARGDALTPAVDVWALGVVFYRCLSGNNPFESSSSTGVLSKLMSGRAPRFRTVCKNLGPHVAVALDRALEPKLGRRYQDMRSFARALAVACEQDGVAVPVRPEPIGLPDFESWRKSAEVEPTGPLGVERRRAVREAVRRVRGSGVLARVLTAALMAAGIGAAPRVTLDVQSARKESPAEVARTIAVRTAGASIPTATSFANGSPRAPVAEPTTQEGIELAKSFAPVAVREVPDVHAKLLRSRSRNHRKVERTQQIAPSPERMSAPSLVARGIVTDWDWE